MDDQIVYLTSASVALLTMVVHTAIRWKPGCNPGLYILSGGVSGLLTFISNRAQIEFVEAWSETHHTHVPIEYTLPLITTALIMLGAVVTVSAAEEGLKR